MRLATAAFVLACAAVFLSAVASARPPEAASAPDASGTRTREVGRLRMRDRIVPLTLESLAEHGAASELKDAFATELMADIERERPSPDDGRDRPSLVE